MNRFPHYFQSDSETSGLICLQIICKYYGVFRSAEDLRNLATNTKQDTSILALRKTAEVLGFKTAIAKVDLQNLETIHHPCILELCNNHFVVLYKIKNGRAFISDPKKGLIRYNLDELITLSSEFKEAFCLRLALTPNFDTTGISRNNDFTIKHLTSYFKLHKRLLVQVLLGFLCGSILSLFFPFLTQSIVDVGIANADIHFIILILIAQTVLVISQTIIEFIRNWILLNISLKITIALISDFLIKLMKLPMVFFQRKPIGDLKQRMEDHSRIQQFLTNNLVGMLFGILTFLIYSIVIGIYNIHILLIYYLGCVVYLLWIFAFLNKRKALDTKRFEESVSDQNKVYEMLTGVQDIKLNGWEDQKRWDWERIQTKLFRISLQSLKLSQYQNIGAITISQFINITISFISAAAVVDGEITLGALVAIQYMVGQLSGPVHEFIRFVTAAQDTRLSLERIREVNNEPDESNEIASVMELPKNHSITIKDLSFGYTDTNLILKNINVSIPHGKVTAIVGESGSGKTTLIKLMLHYFKIKKGQINIGETSLTDIDINVWRSKCGAVMQDGMIFSDTVINNIALNQAYANNPDLEYAANISSIKEFIDQLPQGYRTVIGHGGVALSQGQKQRLLIARAVYRNPAFLFFDEATNALDSKNEAAIVEKLRGFYAGRTVVIVAHRLSTVQKADQIIVLHKGSIVEIGNHASLFGLQGHYYSLVQNQLDI